MIAVASNCTSASNSTPAESCGGIISTHRREINQPWKENISNYCPYVYYSLMSVSFYEHDSGSDKAGGGRALGLKGTRPCASDDWPDIDYQVSSRTNMSS